jgi:hypothetical protein
MSRDRVGEVEQRMRLMPSRCQETGRLLWVAHSSVISLHHRGCSDAGYSRLSRVTSGVGFEHEKWVYGTADEDTGRWFRKYTEADS